MELTFDLPSTPEAAPLARAKLVPLSRVLNGAVLVDLLLVVTELVGSALRQGWARGLRVSVRAADAERVWGEVAGEGDAEAVIRPADEGWTLQLVDSIVSRWGVRDGSARVWFEIDRG
jgi:hypothetical protein